VRILHDLPFDLGIAHVKISAGNIRENLLKLREKAYRPVQLLKNTWAPRNMSLPQRLTLNDPHEDSVSHGIVAKLTSVAEYFQRRRFSQTVWWPYL